MENQHLHPSSPISSRRTRLGAIGLGVASLVIGATMAYPVTAVADPQPVLASRTIAVFGDSLSQSNSSDADGQPGTHFGSPGAQVGDGSWAKTLEASGARIVGYARGGAQTREIAAQATPTPEADQAIIMAGSNDCAAGRSVEETLAGVQEIAQKTGLPPERIAIAAPPPNTPNAAALVAYQQAIPAFAAKHGYRSLVTPTVLRAPDGQSLAPEMTTDGVHLNAQGAAVVGQSIIAQLTAGEADQPLTQS